MAKRMGLEDIIRDAMSKVGTGATGEVPRRRRKVSSKGYQSRRLQPPAKKMTSQEMRELEESNRRLPRSRVYPNWSKPKSIRSK